VAPNARNDLPRISQPSHGGRALKRLRSYAVFSNENTGTGGLVKVGAGETALSGPLSFGGGISLTDGRLVLTSSANTFTGGVAINGGTINFVMDSAGSAEKLMIDGPVPNLGGWAFLNESPATYDPVMGLVAASGQPPPGSQQFVEASANVPEPVAIMPLAMLAAAGLLRRRSGGRASPAYCHPAVLSRWPIGRKAVRWRV
jgi:autotransporter-associated beta strand protein